MMAFLSDFIDRKPAVGIFLSMAESRQQQRRPPRRRRGRPDPLRGQRGDVWVEMGGAFFWRSNAVEVEIDGTTYKLALVQ